MIRTVTRTQSVKAYARISVPCLQLARDREVYELSTGDAPWDVSAVHVGVLLQHVHESVRQKVPTRAARAFWGHHSLSGIVQSA